MNPRQVLFLIGLTVLLIVVVLLTGSVTLFTGSMIPALFISLILAVICVALIIWLICVRLFKSDADDEVSDPDQTDQN